MTKVLLAPLPAGGILRKQWNRDLPLIPLKAPAVRLGPRQTIQFVSAGRLIFALPLL
jgi:hypothetical protein